MIPQWNSIWYTKKYRRKWDLLYFPISSCFTVYHPLGPERIACSFCGILTIVTKHYPFGSWRYKLNWKLVRIMFTDPFIVLLFIYPTLWLLKISQKSILFVNKILNILNFTSTKNVGFILLSIKDNVLRKPDKSSCDICFKNNPFAYFQ